MTVGKNNRKGRRHQKPDHLTNKVDRSEWMKAMRISGAMSAHDECMAEVERRWGSVDRLVAKVPPDLADRFRSAQAKLDEAVEDDDADRIARKAAVVVKGVEVVERWCRDNGVTPDASPVIVATAHDGRRIGIAKDGGEATLLRDQYRDRFEVYSLEEVANIVLSHQTALVSAVKDAFPGAKVTAVKADQPPEGQADFDFKRGDVIPF